MILVNGCSFTEGVGLESPKDHAWPSLLKGMVSKDVVNIAEGGKDNKEMYHQFVTWIAWALRGKARMPDTIIWQTTQHHRDSVRLYGAEYEQFNNLESQLENNNARYYKLDSYGTPIELRKRKVKAKEDNDWKRLQEIKNLGTGDFILCTDEYGNPLNIRPLGDEYRRSGELKTCALIFSLQTMCKAYGIRLIILNYFGHPKEMKGDPLFEMIDRSDYVIHNSRYFGMLDALMKQGFERLSCGHWNVDGHLFQADVVADFYNHKKQFVVNEHYHRPIKTNIIFRYAEMSHPSAKTILKNLNMSEKKQ